MASFDRIFTLVFAFILGFFIIGIIANMYQYMNRPECATHEMLIQDDAGVFRCVSTDNAYIIQSRKR